ncbi:hypothetical protein I3J09_28100 (plasmid) [Streptomyces clavuligerus]|uniref:hypothetical protein n=1 Tax=Streptomyces clavuligerus TaxID=1901 RepID=UPI00020D913F|nr:hypothetical protein [Streptomyces clavuligerus]ANW22633.1 hypothetical protein BB341_30480 [Streptomyces clavuligerus]AXU16899.1 hypothetical protein D1794_29505 [Streptomyces clavuligerus]AXU17493.1 hypothetical protein D1794_33650 [Streptomyces clavuligerus]MBY6301024.1 hypothetical protein [Streptomyces clavuligerus]QPL66869.1 hypothetical protein I3J04_28205 [Streptomyces clavuligerus]
MAGQRRGAASIMDTLGSPAVGALVGIAGLAVPVVGWLADHVNLKVLLAVQAGLILVLATGHWWMRKAYIQLRRANNLKTMDDAAYYDRVRSQLERELISDYREIADGHLRVFASEVPRLSALLVKTVTDAASEPQRILAADLTTDPALLAGRREYLAANRRFTESGGTISRLFIAYRADLIRPGYARALLDLVGHHRDLGVTCGLAVRDRLRADQAVDVVVFAGAAALVEEEQGDADYQRGRSSVYFKNVDRWRGRFEEVWGQGSGSAPRTLQTYESAVRPMLDTGAWDEGRASTAVDGL